jgi:hypothetical protein
MSLESLLEERRLEFELLVITLDEDITYSVCVADPHSGQTVFNWDSGVSATFSTGNYQLLYKYRT